MGLTLTLSFVRSLPFTLETSNFLVRYVYYFMLGHKIMEAQVYPKSTAQSLVLCSLGGARNLTEVRDVLV